MKRGDPTNTHLIYSCSTVFHTDVERTRSSLNNPPPTSSVHSENVDSFNLVEVYFFFLLFVVGRALRHSYEEFSCPTEMSHFFGELTEKLEQICISNISKNQYESIAFLVPIDPYWYMKTLKSTLQMNKY